MPAKSSGLDASKMHAAAEEATALLRALGNRDRLLLLCHLSQGERCVSDLEDELGIHQPSLSQQLTVLRTQRLVSTRRDGKRIYYSLGDAKARQVLETLYRLFCKPRRRVRAARSRAVRTKSARGRARLSDDRSHDA